MERYLEVLWSDYLQHIEDIHHSKLKYPLRSYFTTIGNLIIFDLKKELDPEIKQLVTLMFESYFDD